jgi:hypothetical protein
MCRHIGNLACTVGVLFSMPISTVVVEALAVVVCREIYSLVDGTVGVWAAVCDVRKRLTVTNSEVQEALHYALGRGWIEGVATPMFFVMLLQPGRALCSAHPTGAEGRLFKYAE